jgi:hypothetical protein
MTVAGMFYGASTERDILRWKHFLIHQSYPVTMTLPTISG